MFVEHRWREKVDLFWFDSLSLYSIGSLALDYWPRPFEREETPFSSRSFLSVFSACNRCRWSDPPMDLPRSKIFGKVEWPVIRDKRCLIIIPSSRIESSMSISWKSGKRNWQYPSSPLRLLLGVVEGHTLRVIVLPALNIYYQERLSSLINLQARRTIKKLTGNMSVKIEHRSEIMLIQRKTCTRLAKDYNRVFLVYVSHFFVPV